MKHIIDLLSFLVSSEVAGVATWLGTIASGLVLWNVRTIRNDFLFAARLPQLMESLQSSASALSKHLNDFDGSIEAIRLEATTCKANLTNLAQKLRGRAKKSIKKSTESLISDLDAYERQALTKDSVRKTYRLLNGLIQDLRNLTEDQKWSSRDAG